MAVAVLLNPFGGAGRSADVGERVVQRLARAGLRVVALRADTRDRARELAVEAVRSGADGLVVVGGDGTVQLGVAACAGTKVPLGVVPAGTGNDSAEGLGLHRADPVAATDLVITALRTGRSRLLDTMAVTCADGTTHTCFGVVCLGFDAQVNVRANRWRRPRGRLRYPVALLAELPALTRFDYELGLDDGPLRHGRHQVVAVANGRSFGGGMLIAPYAQPDDGLLDVVTIDAANATFLHVAPRVFWGGHVRHPSVTVRRARRVQVRLPGRELTAYADGEPLGPAPVTVEVVPASLRLLVNPAGLPVSPGSPTPPGSPDRSPDPSVGGSGRP